MGHPSLSKSIIDRVANIAKAMARKSGEDFDDLNQEGLIGAWKTSAKYDGKGTIEGWCSIRARGAMQDYLRRNDYLSRWHRKQVKEGRMVAPKIVSLDYLPSKEREKL